MHYSSLVHSPVYIIDFCPHPNLQAVKIKYLLFTSEPHVCDVFRFCHTHTRSSPDSALGFQPVVFGAVCE